MYEAAILSTTSKAVSCKGADLPTPLSFCALWDHVESCHLCTCEAHLVLRCKFKGNPKPFERQGVHLRISEAVLCRRCLGLP